MYCKYSILFPGLSLQAMDLTPEENSFVEYWEQNRLKKKKVWKYLSVGMPLGAMLACAILVNVFSDWNAAGNYLRYNKETLIMVVAGILLTVVFIVVFSAKHRWDLQEQQYRELLAKKTRD